MSGPEFNRAGWAAGIDDGGEWLAVPGRNPDLYSDREQAEEVARLRGKGLSVAHVAEVIQPAGYAYWMTPGTCRRIS